MAAEKNALWSFDELMKAVPFAIADGHGDQPITGFSIDTRTLKPGEVFVALTDQRDGHDFVPAAFGAGAAAAIVDAGYERKDADGVLIRCDLRDYRQINAQLDRETAGDTLVALQWIGDSARQRLSPSARVIAVTGSAGKTGTKEMLRACLSRLGKVHASQRSFNNHWGVPLTLANMPRDVDFAVLEIGMNHAGEIAALVPWVSPHAAIVTTVEAVHLEHFESVEAIAHAKAEIFSGLASGGAAIIKRDSPYFDLLRVRAQAEAARVISFGLDGRADVYAQSVRLDEEGSDIVARAGHDTISYRLAMPGRHIAENSLAAVAALQAIGADISKAVEALAALPPPPGRGARSLLKAAGGHILLIDESYNANPASMRAALATLSGVSRLKYARKIAVLGDMLELGAAARELHRGLLDAVMTACVDQLFVCGPHMKSLYDAAPAAIKGGYAETAEGLTDLVAGALRAGDAVMVKASNGTRLGVLTAALRGRFAVEGT